MKKILIDSSVIIIQFKDYVNFLGVVINYKLTWNEQTHIKYPFLYIGLQISFHVHSEFHFSSFVFLDHHGQDDMNNYISQYYSEPSSGKLQQTLSSIKVAPQYFRLLYYVLFCRYRDPRPSTSHYNSSHRRAPA